MKEKYWFGKKEEKIYPGAETNQSQMTAKLKEVSSPDMLPIPTFQKGIKVFLTLLSIRALVLGHSRVFAYCLFVYCIIFCPASA